MLLPWQVLGLSEGRVNVDTFSSITQSRAFGDALERKVPSDTEFRKR